MPAYHSGILSQTGRESFTLPLRPTTPNLTLPLAPRNLMVTSPYNIGMSDVRWDNPILLPQNNGLQIIGVNVYRSINNPYGPYELLNDSPINVLFLRDQTEEVQVTEDATPTIRHELEPDGAWKVYAMHKPIVKPGSNGETTDNIQDVMVEIDDGDGNFVVVPAYSVSGKFGEIELISAPIFNLTLEQIIPPRLPWPPNGRVRITYKYIKHSVLSRLNQRIFYKATTVAVDPTDNSKRIETPIDEVEYRSTFDIEEIDYIWKEAMRRNNWILEQGGERVKIFVRKNMGERCSDYEETHGQSQNDCPNCFPAGTLVRTSIGWKGIETISKGDMVLSSDGHFHKVSDKFIRDFKGDLISIYSSVSTNPILSTPNHPYLTMHSDHNRKKCGPECNDFIKNGDGIRLERPDVRLLPSGKWWARVQVNGSRGKGRKSLGTYETREEAIEIIQQYRTKNYNPRHNLVWKEASKIVKGDWLISKWCNYNNDLIETSIPEQFKKTGKDGPERKGARIFKIDEEFLWVVGLYIAEGSSGKRSINFSLHKNEIDYQNRVLSFFKKYGYNGSVHRVGNTNGVCVSVFGSSLAEWFPEWIGKKCYNKIIPNELMYLPKEKAKALIQGIYDGDGSKSDHEITQTSEILALQLSELLHRIGEQSIIRQQVSKKLTPKGNKRRVAYCVSWAEDTLIHNNRKGRWVFKNELLSVVKKVLKVPFSGKVYNLEVDGDPTYVVNGIVAHNCYGTSYVGGYDGPYNVMIAPPEAEKTIELLDIGMRVNFEYESWTMAFPMLNERDVVVRQNNERYVVGPVNYQGSRGATYQQHFRMSYIDEKDIRYRIGIPGGETQVPADWDRYRSVAPTPASPERPVKPEIDKAKLVRGRTVTFENISY
jgi:intein/homing endonuclease